MLYPSRPCRCCCWPRLIGALALVRAPGFGQRLYSGHVWFPFIPSPSGGGLGWGRPMSFEAFMIVAAVLFCIGLYGSLARRNVLAVLMSIELMFNAVNVTLVAMAKYLGSGQLAAGHWSRADRAGVRGVHHHCSGGGNCVGSRYSVCHVPDKRVGGPHRSLGNEALGPEYVGAVQKGIEPDAG